MSLDKNERTALNILTLRGLHSAAVCVEKMLREGETMVRVEVSGPVARVTILPPANASALWREAATWRQTASEVDYFTQHHGIEVRWAVTRAEEELRRIAHAARQVH